MIIQSTFWICDACTNVEACIFQIRMILDGSCSGKLSPNNAKSTMYIATRLNYRLNQYLHSIGPTIPVVSSYVY